MTTFLTSAVSIVLVFLPLASRAATSSGVTGEVNWQISQRKTKARLMLGGRAVANIYQNIIRWATGRRHMWWEMVQILALCGAVPGIWYLRRRLKRRDSDAVSWQSPSKLKTGVNVNEDDSSGAYLQLRLYLVFLTQAQMGTRAC